MNTKTDTPPTLTATGLALLVAGQLMPQMDFSIVNVALEAISQSLDASQTELGLIVSLYGLAFAISLAMSGRLGDRYGRKKLFMTGICLFALSSLLCGLATSIWFLIVARILQGISAALLLPQILATIHVTLRGERHSKAIGLYSSVGGLSFIIGQILGGWLVSANLFDMGWRTVFYVNLPVCALILYLGRKYIPKTREVRAASLDWTGTSLFALMVFLVLASVSAVPATGWASYIYIMLFATLPIGYLLWQIESKQEQEHKLPLLPPALFKLHKVRAGILSLMLLSATFGGFMFIVALTLQSGFNWGSFASGNGFLGLGAAYFIGSLLAGKYARWFKTAGFSGVIFTGAVLNIIGYTVLYHMISHNAQTLTAMVLQFPMIIIGFGNAFVVNSSIRLTLADIPAHYAGAGSAFMTTLQQAAVALGTALLGSVYAQNLTAADPHHLISLKSGLMVLGLFMILLLIGHSFSFRKRSALAGEQP